MLIPSCFYESSIEEKHSNNTWWEERCEAGILTAMLAKDESVTFWQEGVYIGTYSAWPF